MTIVSVAPPVDAEGAALRVIISAPGRKVAVQTYTRVLDQVRLALDEVDHLVVPGRAARPEWAIGDLSAAGDVEAVLVPLAPAGPRPSETLRMVSGGLVGGVRTLHEEATIPAYFSPSVVDRVRAMGSRIGAGELADVRLAALAAGAGVEPALVDRTTVENAQRAVAGSRAALSSVIGRLDVLNVRNRTKPRAQVFDERTRRAVTIIAGPDDVDRLRSAWSSRVRAAGLLTRNAVGQALRLELHDLEILPADQAPQDPITLLGVNPDITGGFGAAAYVARLRRG